METSPPVRDVAERDRANRNKFIAVAVTSVVVLVAIVLAVGYFTHFASSELTPEYANSVVDTALSRLSSSNGSLDFCESYRLVIKDNDTTLLLDRIDNCTSLTTSLNEPSGNETEPKPDILCRVAATNVHVVKVNRSNTDCDYSTTINVRFSFNDKQQVQNITIAPNDQARSGSTIPDGIAEHIAAALAPELIYATYSYGVSDLNIHRNQPDSKVYCRLIPTHC